MSLLMQIFIGLVAVALGIFLGMPGKQPDEDSESLEGGRIGAHGKKRVRDLELALGRAARRSKGAKRYFTPLDLLRRDRRASERRRSRSHFKTVAPSRDRKS
jgi:hypothetical protein